MLSALFEVKDGRLAWWVAVLCVVLTGLIQPPPAEAAQQANPEWSAIPFPKGVSLPLPVGVAVLVNRIERINENTNTFEGHIDVRYRWRDPRLAFAVTDMATDRLEFDDEVALAKLQTIWNPRITITNMVESDAQKRVGLFIYPDGSVDLIHRIKATFETRFNLRAFPFDTQLLPVIMLSSKYNINQIKLIQEQRDIDHSGLSPDLRLKEWIPQGLTFRVSQVRAWSGSFTPQLEANVKITRGSGMIMMGVFIPFLLLMTVPTIFVVLKQADLLSRLNAWAASILALVALSFTIGLRYPALGGDNLISQAISTGYAYQLLSVFLAVTIYNPLIADRLGNKLIVAELATYLRWAVPVLFIGILITSALLRAYSW